MNLSVATEQQLLQEAADKTGSLRILMVSARYAPYVGGTEMHVHEVGQRMLALGHDVTVLTTDTSKKLPTHEENDGLHVIRVAAYPANRDYYFAPGLYAAITQGHWDVIHLQGYHTLVAPLTMLAAIASKTPFVVTFHSGGHSSQLRTSARGTQRALLRPLLNRAARLICVSESEAHFFMENLGIDKDHFVIVPNGSQMPKLTTAVPPTTGTLLVSPGRLERYKGHQRAISALPAVLELKPDVRLRIVGTGPYENDLRQLAQSLGIADKVEISGIASTDRQAMAVLLSQASLVVLFSDYEAHPLGIMEALSLGCSVLVSDSPGLNDLAAKGWAKGIPPDSSSDVIAAAIVRQLDNPIHPQVVALPTWDECTASLIDTYRGVIGNGQSGRQQSVAGR